MAPPVYMMLSLTDQCNLYCKMCGCPHTAAKYRGQELSERDIKGIIDQIALWNKDAEVVFSGGEPFLRSDILELIEYACARGLRISVNTNGTLIDSSVAYYLVRAPLYALTVSLDADNLRANDGIRGADVYERALRGLEYVRKAKERRGSWRPLVNLNVTIMKENSRSLNDMVKLARFCGAQNIFFQPVVTDNTDVQNNNYLRMNDESISDLLAALDRIKSEAYRKKIHVQVPEPELLRAYFSMRQGQTAPRQWPCFVGYTRMSISTHGRVYSCAESFGNVRTQSLKEIWYSPRARQLRHKYKKCRKFCLQTCYACPNSESIRNIIRAFLRDMVAPCQK